jgi:ATP-dependent RNA helicase DeaD
VQDGDVAHVEGTKLGAANADIDHVLHLVDARDRLGAVINLLLANPDEQMLVFARTRADVGDIADALVAAGFAASSLSGEMEQPARDRALAAFKRGDLRALVATDVAARGIDVQDIARVLHADPPGDADTYTHRSGRTGRAGRKGVSSVLVPPSVMAKVIRLMQRAGVTYRFDKLPGAAEIRARNEERVFETLTGEEEAGGPAPDERAKALAERLAQAENVPRTIARLLMRARQATGPEPRDIRVIEPPSEAPRATRRGVTGRAERPRFGAERPRFDSDRPRFDSDRPRFGSERPPADSDRPRFDSDRPPASSQRFDSQRPPRDLSREWAPFQVSWGEVHGADSRRMLAMLCRRGGIGSGDVGAIRIGRLASTVEIARDVAEPFAEAAGKTDLRDPRIVIRPIEAGAADGGRERPKGKRAPAHAARERWEAPRPEHAAHEPEPAAHERAPNEPPFADAHAEGRTTKGHRPAPRTESRPTKEHRSESPRAEGHTTKGHRAAPRAEGRPTKAGGAAARYPAGKTKGWVKKPASRATRVGDAPPKRRRIA